MRYLRRCQRCGLNASVCLCAGLSPKMTKPPTTFNIPPLSTLFSWTNPNPNRQVAVVLPSSQSYLEMEKIGSPQKWSPQKKNYTELTLFDEVDDSHNLSYTSLRDLMPSNRPPSPVKRLKRESLRVVEEAGKEHDADNDDELFCDRPPIKNRLVERAARAYLLPTSAPQTPPDQFFARYWARLTTGGSSNLERQQLQQQSVSAEDLWAPASRGCSRGCSNGCLSCLPTLLWVDLTGAFRSLFTHLRPQPLLRS